LPQMLYRERRWGFRTNPPETRKGNKPMYLYRPGTMVHPTRWRKGREHTEPKCTVGTVRIYPLLVLTSFLEQEGGRGIERREKDNTHIYI